MKSVVLLSSGMDSTVNLYEAIKAGSVELALTFHYGQRSAASEIAQSKNIANQLGVRHLTVELPFFKNWGSSSLLNESHTLPTNDEVKIENLEQSRRTAQSVWVPNRNGVFLNIAAGFAESLHADTIVPGFNKEESATFPDNSDDFVKASTRALSFSTANQVKIHCFTINLDKNEIVKRGIELKVDWSLIWPCYQNLDKWCGQCESCLRAKRAFEKNNISWLGY